MGGVIVVARVAEENCAHFTWPRFGLNSHGANTDLAAIGIVLFLDLVDSLISGVLLEPAAASTALTGDDSNWESHIFSCEM